VCLRPEDEMLKKRWNVAGVSLASENSGRFVFMVRICFDGG